MRYSSILKSFNARNYGNFNAPPAHLNGNILAPNFVNQNRNISKTKRSTSVMWIIITKQWFYVQYKRIPFSVYFIEMNGTRFVSNPDPTRFVQSKTTQVQCTWLFLLHKHFLSGQFGFWYSQLKPNPKSPQLP